MLDKTSKTLLLKIAKEAILSAIEKRKITFPKDLPSTLTEGGAAFVTLKLNGELRGCIGSLKAERPLFLDIAINAMLSASSDPRFPPVSESELENLTIEVSVLSPPKPLLYQNPSQILEKLDPTLGVILEKDYKRATFLPQVWEEIPDKISFLKELALKAGLKPDDWQKARLSVYKVEKFAKKFTEIL